MFKAVLFLYCHLNVYSILHDISFTCDTSNLYLLFSVKLHTDLLQESGVDFLTVSIFSFQFHFFFSLSSLFASFGLFALFQFLMVEV